jgi:Domain of unknown function (DUF5753)
LSAGCEEPGLADGPQREALLPGVRGTAAPETWRQGQDPLPVRERGDLGLEAAAWQIRCYQPHIIPPWLQTSRYAEAAARADIPAGPAGVPAPRLLAARREMLARPGPHLWAVIDEAALLRPAGDPDVMREQVACLLRAAGRPNIAIQVLRLSAGLTPACAPFTLLRFAEPGVPDVVYVDTPAGTLAVECTADIDRYHMLINTLALAADPPGATTGILQGMLERIR